jgi:hypothetical protein
MNTNIVDVDDDISNDCPVIETPFSDRMNKHLEIVIQTNPHGTKTQDNLHRLQQITDDVKLLTKQLQLSIESNKNHNASLSTLGRSIMFLSLIMLTEYFHF